jgi:alkylated DNA repair protein (DNA oxidative demethylase)
MAGAVAPGVVLWPRHLDRDAQRALLEEVFARLREAPFYRPTMPRSGRAFSVEQTNFGSLGWVSDAKGYRYEPRHPSTGRTWPPMPPILLRLWRGLASCAVPPECCLVNLYRHGARMGLHQDRDEAALDAPVMSVSLGDDAVFRIGGATRHSQSRSVKLGSGDVIVFGGVARLAFHGIDRVIADSSTLVPGGGRLNLTLRRVSAVHAKTPDQGG